MSQSVESSSHELSKEDVSSESKSWPANEKQYDLLHIIGHGATSKVYAAQCLSNRKKCAIKVVNLENCETNSGLKEINREITSMRQLRHENIVGYHISFLCDTKLHIVMDLCEEGSLLEKIKAIKAERSTDHGVFDEHTIATILCDVLHGLTYIHDNDLVHRDIKCGNLLVCSNGSIKIADFGVSAFLHSLPVTETLQKEKHDCMNPGRRHTFVGTPCWAAPEVMNQLHNTYPDLYPTINKTLVHCEHCLYHNASESQDNRRSVTRKLSLIYQPKPSQRRLSQPLCGYSDLAAHSRRASVSCECKVQGYDWKADIWSLGISAIELATGHAPYAKFAPFKVVLMTLQNDPPTIDTCATSSKQYENYGQRFRRFCRVCLMKDPDQRPSAKELLQHSFIKAKCKDRAFLRRVLLSGIVPQPQQPKRSEEMHEQQDHVANVDWNFPSDINVTTPVSPFSGSSSELSHITISATISQPAINSPSLPEHNTNQIVQQYPLEQETDESSQATSAPSTSQDGATQEKAKTPVEYKLTLVKRHPQSEKELMIISFPYILGQDAPLSIANDLVEADLLGKNNLLIVAHYIDKLITSPSLCEVSFALYPQPSKDISISQQIINDYAKLSITP